MPETSLRNDEQIRRNIELAYIGLTFKGELVDAARPLKSCGEGITLVDIGLFSISTTSVLVKIRNARKVIE